MKLTFADLAEQLHRNGYTPIPIIAGEKRPAIPKWSEVNYAETPPLLQELKNKYPRASTGILLGRTCVVDIDVLDEKTANLCLELITSKLGKAPIRQGRTPKTALFFKVEGPSFKKLATQPYLIDGERAQVEILCEGQQVVVFGIHPDTQQHYRWLTPSLLEVAASDLPTITKTQAEQLIGQLTATLSPSSFQSQESYQPFYDQTDYNNSSPKSQEGRNGYLYSKGCALRAQGADQADVAAELQRLNSRASVDDHPNFAEGPLTDSELNQIIASVVKFEAVASHEEMRSLVQRLNSKHAVVMIGGKCVIANEEFDPSFGYENITFSTQADLIARYANRSIRHGKVKTSEGRAWLNHPDRRQYDGIVFAPGQEVSGYLNLDRGFAVTPKPGSCSLFLNHIRNNLCRGDEELSDYLLAWMADSVQNRSRRPGVSVVLRGRQGTGKGIFCSQFGALFGRHFIQISQAGHLTGNFNSHLKDKLVVHADEAFWAGDKKGEGVLKAMITEDTIQIEMKGKDVVTFRNHIRLIISSNNDWVVPVGNEERRFFVLDVGDARMQDREYFASIISEMENGGREALLSYLLDYDLYGIDVGRPPRTSALMDQKAHSSSSVQGWWYERLMEGHLTSEVKKWDAEISTDTLYEDYRDFNQKMGVKRPSAPSAFGKSLRALIPTLERSRPSKGKGRSYVYRIPPLETCRRQFDLHTMGNHDWPLAES
jgi:hypothetical protein